VHRLSTKTVEKAKEPGYYCDGGGLYLQVSPTGSKSWIFRYTRHGRSHEMSLGSERDVSLAEARTKASDARRQLVGGTDALAAREGHRAQEKLQKAGTISFAECAKKYIASHRAGWRNEKHAEQWQNTLDTYAGPVIGELAVKDVDTALVLASLGRSGRRSPRPPAGRRAHPGPRTPSAGSKVRWQRIEAVCTPQKFRPGLKHPLNPASRCRVRRSRVVYSLEREPHPHSIRLLSLGTTDFFGFFPCGRGDIVASDSEGEERVKRAVQ